MLRYLTSLAVLFGVSSVVQAGEVKIEGVHLCCGGCVKSVAKALEGAEGVTDAKCDQEKKTCTFTADTKQHARQAFAKIRKAGYYGKATFDGEKLPEGKPKIEEGAKGNSVNVSSVHLCCGMCTKAITAALKEVKGVSEVSCEQKEGKVAISGTDISLLGVYEALHKAGFHGNIK